jgi:hypothetical protein
MNEEHPQNPPDPPKPEPLSTILIFVVSIVAMIPTGVCSIFFFGKVYGSLMMAFFFFLGLLGWLFRRRRIDEVEMIRRIDKAMGKPSDDPRQMARWVR